MVKAWHESVAIPTYRVGQPEKNPIFLENRVYQGSSGVVYPYPVIESIEKEKTSVTYDAIYLENEYIKVMILPELGGRIQMAYDKIRKRHFIYYNQVIKPALVGLAGPWISGGIEFNWPQHHRPSTYSPVDVNIEQQADGSVTVWVNEREKMFHQQGQAGFTLRPGHAYLEIKGRVYNPTELPQTFLWWANPAVEVNDEYQSVFPPDVNAVFDHGKRAVSTFPIATGTYYKMDYSAGIDISNYRNIFVPTSYMVARSKYNFEGGYENDTRAGMLHVADHHFAPGKKQWTWGNGDFGRAWDRNLTDPVQPGDLPAGVPPLDSSKKMNPHRPYIELMAGVYTENQPDFSWLMPYEEKSFVQYFMPYRELGLVKNTSKDLMLNIEPMGNNKALLRVLATSVQDIRIVVSEEGQIRLSCEKHVTPEEILSLEIDHLTDAQNTAVALYKGNRKVLEYVPENDDIRTVPDAAQPALKPNEIKTNEQLYLTGLHLEQYRHASWDPTEYYREALKRDPDDVRCNNALGLWLMRHCDWESAESYLRRAVKVLQRRNLNPYDGEPLYNLGLCLKYKAMDKNDAFVLDEAYDWFCKCTWNRGWQDAGYLACAQISASRQDWEKALEEVDKALLSGWHNHKARALKAAIMTKMALNVRDFAKESLDINQFNYGVLFEMRQLEKMKEMMRGSANNYDELALDYCAAGLWQNALEVWTLAVAEGAVTAMTDYYIAWVKSHIDPSRVTPVEHTVSVDYCFPNRMDDVLALNHACCLNESDARAHYLLGNLLYDKRNHHWAMREWEKSSKADGSFPTVWRNLALVYANTQDDKRKALSCMEKAFSLDRSDARVLMELDQLYKRLNRSATFRLANLRKHRECIAQRDDLLLEEITLLNQLGRYEEAKTLIDSNTFQPWEGGEGKVLAQYHACRLEMAKKILNTDHPSAKKLQYAEQLLKECMELPDNLGEGKLYGAQENDFYFFLAIVDLHRRAMSQGEEAKKQYEARALQSLEHGLLGTDEPAAALYYNDAKPEKILYKALCCRLLSQLASSNPGVRYGDKEKSIYHKLVNYGEQHYYDDITMDYFAVSLPDLQVWDESLTIKNRKHCARMLELGYYGLGDEEKALRYGKEYNSLGGEPQHLDLVFSILKKALAAM